MDERAPDFSPNESVQPGTIRYHANGYAGPGYYFFSPWAGWRHGHFNKEGQYIFENIGTEPQPDEVNRG